MKAKHLLSLAFVLTMAGDALALSGANAPVLMEENDPILIHQNTSDPIGGPRLPAYNPFYAELEDDVVLLGSVSGVGTVSVELTSTAGDSYSTWFDTSNGSVFIPISGNAGDYTLLITMSSGVQFIGEFTL